VKKQEQQILLLYWARQATAEMRSIAGLLLCEKILHNVLTELGRGNEI